MPIQSKRYVKPSTSGWFLVSIGSLVQRKNSGDRNSIFHGAMERKQGLNRNICEHHQKKRSQGDLEEQGSLDKQLLLMKQRSNGVSCKAGVLSQVPPVMKNTHSFLESRLSLSVRSLLEKTSLS